MSPDVPSAELLPGSLEARVRDHIAQQGRVPTSVSVRPISGGACQDNLRVDLSWADGSSSRMVLRSDAPSSLPGSLDRATEAAVIRAAVAAGVPTPTARWDARDLVRPGAGAWFMDWVDGVVLGGKVARSPALAAARTRLPAQLGQALAAIHSVRPGSLSLRGATEDPVELALSELAQMVERVHRPAQQLALSWLQEHRPSSSGHTLVHRDFRLGNLMVDADDGLVAVLDWEFARYGDPIEDLGWFCVRDWRFGQVQLGGGGICTRDALRAAYTAASGRAVSAEELRFWEVYGNVRWAASAILQGERARAGGKDGQGIDIELLVIPRRAAEMEWEALRLIRETGLWAPVAPNDGTAPGPVGDGTPPQALLQAVRGWLRGPALQALSSADPGLAYQARVVGFLLGGVARQVADTGADSASTPTDHAGICRRLAWELAVVQPRFDLDESVGV